MKLVIGGAFQGKKKYALETFQIDETQMVDGAVCEKEAVFQAALVVHFHEYIRRFMKEEAFLRSLPAQFKEKNPEVVLVTNELGYGIVPIDAFDRTYREMTGRVCCALAKECHQVHRVVCGIGTVIKDA